MLNVVDSIVKFCYDTSTLIYATGIPGPTLHIRVMPNNDKTRRSRGFSASGNFTQALGIPGIAYCVRAQSKSAARFYSGLGISSLVLELVLVFLASNWHYIGASASSNHRAFTTGGTSNSTTTEE
jgi:hypothetical protein